MEKPVNKFKRPTTRNLTSIRNKDNYNNNNYPSKQNNS